MLVVYNYMTIALAITGFVAFFAASSEYFYSLLYNQNDTGKNLSIFAWVILFAPLAIALTLRIKINTINHTVAQILYWLFATLTGLSISSIFLIYTNDSIARIFFISASIFGVGSIYGYTTKKDLTGLGSLLMMGLTGVILAVLVNLFFGSSALEFSISIMCVIIFTGLTAYDTQKLKKIYFTYAIEQPNLVNTIAIIGALSLYLDFINIFLSLLRLSGKRK